MRLALTPAALLLISGCFGAGVALGSWAQSATMGVVIATALRDGGVRYEVPPEDPDAAGQPMRCFEVRDPAECNGSP